MRVLFSQGLISISKPRCGSTSVRRILNGLVDLEKGDISVDIADQRPPYHPHHPAPYLKKLLVEDGHDISGMTTFIITRNPINMLWSYYHFFNPDSKGQYNYSPNYDANSPISFENWVMNGRVGMNAGALGLAPKSISTKNLTPLSLEAHTDSWTGKREVDFIFHLEEIDKFISWLSERTGREVKVLHVNGSGSEPLPDLGTGILDRIRQLFPLESKMYGI